jgi:hypothetical protein
MAGLTSPIHRSASRGRAGKCKIDWKVIEKVGEGVEEMRNKGRESFVFDLGIGAWGDNNI